MCPARFMGWIWGPSGADNTQVGPMLAPWTLLSGYWRYIASYVFIICSCSTSVSNNFDIIPRDKGDTNRQFRQHIWNVNSMAIIFFISLKTGGVYMGQRKWSSFVRIIACHQFDVIPLPESMVTYFQLELKSTLLIIHIIADRIFVIAKQVYNHNNLENIVR